VRHFSYAVMLFGCLAVVLPLGRWPGAPVLSRPIRLTATVLAAGGPFLLWDVIATDRGQWSFDPRQTLRARALGLPIEELAFFVVIPIAVVLTLEAVRVLRDEPRRMPGRRRTR